MADHTDTADLHEFWSTQPVPQEEGGFSLAGPMDVAKTVNDIPTEPYPIASTFEWYTPDLDKPEELHAIYELLRDNYVEDDDSMFRFNYQEEFLRWALTPPGYIKDWHVAVRRRSDKKPLAFIAGIPITMKMGTPISMAEKAEGEMYEKPRPICEINFLCIHKQLRSKRLAPILIKEVTRRVNLTNVWQAVYTAGVRLPTPFATGKYFHRSLNPEKLVAIRFSGIPPQFSKFQNPIAMLKRVNQLPAQPKSRNLRPMRKKDVSQVAVLLSNHLKNYDVAPIFNREEVEHYLLPREGVVETYVIETQGKITDFFSFYSLPSTVIGNSKYTQLNAAYLFYYVAATVPLTQLMTDMLITAHSLGFDVCNLVGVLENMSFVEELRFLPGDGQLQYYFYNWAYPTIDSSRVGLVML